VTIVELRTLMTRILNAADKANTEAEHHPDRDRRMYCEGSAHGLRAASKMIEEALGAAASGKAGGR
jgi:hypothetical protein